MEGDAGSGQLTPTPPLPESKLATGRWFTGVCAAVAIAAVVLSAVGVLALIGHHRSAAAADGEAAAVAAAKDCISATQAPDVKAMTGSQRKIIECSTENYAPQANLYSGLLADAYQTAQAQVKITNIRAAAEKHNPDGSIDVLVATRVSMSNVQAQDQELSYRLRVRMMPVDGTYKIDSIDPVSK